MVASVGPTGIRHSHLAQRTRQGHLTGSRGNITVLVIEFLFDQCPSEVSVTGSSVLELLHQVPGGQLVHVVHGHCVASTDLHCPRDIDVVGQGGGKLAKLSYVDWFGWALGLNPGFICRDRIWKGLKFVVDLNKKRFG